MARTRGLTSTELHDRVDMLTSEVSRLRKLLATKPVHGLLEVWAAEADAYERSGNRVAARALRKRIDELKETLQ